MIKKITLFLCLAGLISTLSFGQDLENPGRIKKQKQRDKLFFGGDFAMQFGSITDIEIGSLLAYCVLLRLPLAPGINYEYYRDKTFRLVIETH